MNGDAGLDERVDELSRGQEVRLIGRDDEAARIAPFRAAHQFVELGDRDATTPTSKPAATAWESITTWLRIATGNYITAATATAATTAATATSHVSTTYSRLHFSDALARHRPAIAVAAFDG